MKPIVRRSLAVTLLGASMAIGVGSCGSEDTCACTYPGDNPRVDDGPVIATEQPGEDDFDPAGMTVGKLTLQGGCLVISDAVPLWPYGAQWDEDTSSVRVPTWSAPVRADRRATLGGGFIKLPAKRPDWLSAEAFEDAVECLDRREIPRRRVFFVARGDPIL